MRVAFLVIAACLTSASCAWTDVSSVVDPKYANRGYRKILVLVPDADLEVVSETESALVEELRARGANAARSVDVVFPTRSYTEDELRETLMANEIQAVLTVNLFDEFTTESYVPEGPTHTSGTLSTNETNYATRNYSTTNFSTTSYSSGGYSISKPHRKHAVELLDVESGETAWIASTHTRGNAYAGSGTMRGSLAKEIAAKLIETGIVALQAEPVLAENPR